LAPDAAIPMTSWAPRLAERKARPAIHVGMDRPERKKSSLLRTVRRRAHPMPSTKAKYTIRMA
jgi:hypothetical protein